MKTERYLLSLILMFAITLPCIADEEKEDENTIYGTWYAQVMEGEPRPEDATFKLVIKKDTIDLYMSEEGQGGDAKDEKEERTESFKYTHDKEKATLTLYELDDEGNPDEDPEVVLKYSFVDDMLVFRYSEGSDDEEQTMELTRKPEGTKAHQKQRKEQGDKGESREIGRGDIEGDEASE